MDRGKVTAAPPSTVATLRSLPANTWRADDSLLDRARTLVRIGGEAFFWGIRIFALTCGVGELRSCRDPLLGQPREQPDDPGGGVARRYGVGPQAVAQRRRK